jgi:hypothetical protein
MRFDPEKFFRKRGLSKSMEMLKATRILWVAREVMFW